MTTRRSARIGSRRILVLLAIASVLLAACGGSTPSATASTRAAATSTAATGTGASSGLSRGGTLVVGLNASPESLNPNLWKSSTDRDVFEQVFEPLVDHNQAGNIVPRLATKWTVSPNGTLYTFTIRKGVKFQDGESFTPEDVQYSIQQAMAPTATRTSGLLSVISSITPDDSNYTVAVKLKQPDNQLLDTLVDVMMIPQHPVQKLATNPIGTGPFEFVKWIQNQEIDLKRNPNYWNSQYPLVDNITYKIVPDSSTLVLQLLNGQLDLIEALPLAQVKEVANNPNIQLIQMPQGQDPEMYFMLFNNRNAPFNNKYVREAVSWAIDRQQIKQDLGGYFNVESSVFPPGNPYHNPQAISYDQQDLTKAKSLLAQGGYPNGFKTTLEYFTVSTEYPIMAQVIQQSLAKVGIEVTLKPVTIGTWIDDVFNKQAYAMALTSNTPKNNPFDLLDHEYGQAYQTPLGWNDPSFYTALQKLTTINDPTQLKAAAQRLVAIAQDEEPAVIPGGKVILTAASKKVHGFVESPREIFRLWNVSVGS